jgi:hypothetical protein
MARTQIERPAQARLGDVFMGLSDQRCNWPCLI